MTRFIGKFGEWRCVVIAAQEPQPGQPIVESISWSINGVVTDVTPVMLRPFIGWMNSVNMGLARHHRRMFRHIYKMDDGKCEVWEYRPDTCCPKRIYAGPENGAPGIEQGTKV